MGDERQDAGRIQGNYPKFFTFLSDTDRQVICTRCRVSADHQDGLRKTKASGFYGRSDLEVR